MPFELEYPSTWNIVVVDDEPDSIGIVELVFKFHKASVRTASSGQECIALLAEALPDIVFLDIQMPVMSGWEVLKHIRNTPEMQSLIVIAMTAHAMYGDRERILGAGFNAYFPKPLSPINLVADVRKAIVDGKKLQSI